MLDEDRLPSSEVMAEVGNFEDTALENLWVIKYSVILLSRSQNCVNSYALEVGTLDCEACD